MDRVYKTTNRKQIISNALKSKCSVEKIKVETLKNTMTMFIENKKLGIGLSLNDIRSLTPQEAYIFKNKIGL